MAAIEPSIFRCAVSAAHFFILFRKARKGKVNKMALIICPECGKSVSDKATVCPECGYPLVEKEYSEENTPQQVELVAVTAPKAKKAVIIVLTVIILIVLAAAAFLGYKTVKEKRDKEAAIAQFKTSFETVTYLMLSGGIEAEDACNLINQVWYNAIYEESDSKTDKYVKSNGHYNDFNTALGLLFEDDTFVAKQFAIKENQESVDAEMKLLKNPPEEYAEEYEAINDLYDEYINMTNLAINPTGSLTSYSSSFHEADTNFLNCYNKVNRYLE